MFGLHFSKTAKMRSTAGNWLEMADKVWSYRRDVLSEAEREELRARTEDLRQKLKRKAGAADLKLGIEALEPVLQRLGGKIYPQTVLIDYTEFVLFAAIVFLGFKTYIVQIFQIPTNSMWPSYYGMTADNLLVRGEDPGLAKTAVRFVARGAFRHEAKAGQDGELSFRVLPSGQLASTVVDGRKWLVIPTQYKEYTFFVGNTESRVRVPLDFTDFDQVVHETLYGGSAPYFQALQQVANAGKMEQVRVQAKQGGGESYGALLVHTGKRYAAGQDIFRFDILTGDRVLADCISYHFVRPKVGDGFVFRTGRIAGLDGDNYYVKRLVGVPGDTLEIREPVLLRNGEPIEGSVAFAKNNSRQSTYAGYFDATTCGQQSGSGRDWPYLKRGEMLTVPAKSFLALGDNSGNSLDGRAWGFVPEADVVGRPLFVFFPFTERWGWAR